MTKYTMLKEKCFAASSAFAAMRRAAQVGRGLGLFQCGIGVFEMSHTTVLWYVVEDQWIRLGLGARAR